MRLIYHQSSKLKSSIIIFFPSNLIRERKLKKKEEGNTEILKSQKGTFRKRWRKLLNWEGNTETSEPPYLKHINLVIEDFFPFLLAVGKKIYIT